MEETQGPDCRPVLKGFACGTDSHIPLQYCDSSLSAFKAVSKVKQARFLLRHLLHSPCHTVPAELWRLSVKLPASLLGLKWSCNNLMKTITSMEEHTLFGLILAFSERECMIERRCYMPKLCTWKATSPCKLQHFICFIYPGQVAFFACVVLSCCPFILFSSSVFSPIRSLEHTNDSACCV